MVLVCGALLTGCDAPATVDVGLAAPSFAARDLSGERTALADYRGEVVLLNVWATWCGPCRREMPAFEAIHREQAKHGLNVVAVSIDAASARGEIDRFLEEFDVTFEVLHDPDGRIMETYRTAGVPETFLIGRDGTLLRRWIGRIDPLSPSIRAQIDAALVGRT